MSQKDGVGSTTEKVSGFQLLNKQSDEALMARLASGHTDAFEVLLDRYSNAMVTFCYSFVKNREVAEDLAQETFLRVYRNAGRYKPIAKFSTWLYRIATNLSINEFRKLKLRKALSLYAPMSSSPSGTEIRVIEGIASDADHPLSEVELKEATKLLNEAVERLPENQRTTIVMVEYHHMSYAEIADILDVSVSAIKMRVKRARESLREMLQTLETEE